MDVYYFIGHERNVYPLQMCVRAVFSFFIGLVAIRISGRRSFGRRTAFDNIIAIILGTILGSGIIGTTGYLGTIVAAPVIACLHRFCAWLSLRHSLFSNLIKGKEKVLYQNKKFNKENMRGSLITDSELLEGIRLNANIDSADKAEAIYMESNGEISVIKKES